MRPTRKFELRREQQKVSLLPELPPNLVIVLQTFRSYRSSFYVDLEELNDAVAFTLRVIPRSSRSEIVGEQDGVLKVKLKAPPVDGAANDELVRLVAKQLRVSRSAVVIVSGETSRTKRLRVDGVTADEVRRLID